MPTEDTETIIAWKSKGFWSIKPPGNILAPRLEWIDNSIDIGFKAK